MEFREYQTRSRDSAVYGDAGILYAVLGLASEAGEVANVVKRRMRQCQNPNFKFTSEDLEEVATELGDVLWYIAACCHELGLEMDMVASHNLLKLLGRKEGGTLKDRLGELTER